jgi:hypothetical protein
MQKKSLAIAALLSSLSTVSMVPAAYASSTCDDNHTGPSGLCGCSASPGQTDTCAAAGGYKPNTMDDSPHSVNSTTGATVAGDCEKESCFAGDTNSTTCGGAGGAFGPGTINRANEEDYGRTHKQNNNNQ